MISFLAYIAGSFFAIVAFIRGIMGDGYDPMTAMTAAYAAFIFGILAERIK